MNSTVTLLTKEQLQILQHSLGVDKYGRTPKGFTPYTRNHFCAGDADETTCRKLVEMGYMVQHPTTSWLPYFNCSVTPEGIKAMHRDSPAAPKLTAEQKRYREFIEADTGCSFGEWLHDRAKFAEAE